MNIATRRSVEDLPLAEKRTLESLLGQKLESEQQVFILACTPGVMPDDESRRGAHERIAATLSEAHRDAESQGITDEQADVAVDEAMKPLRRRA